MKCKKRNVFLFLILTCIFVSGNACKTQKEDEIQDNLTWEKHAYLLGGEDIFFASVPGEWKAFIGKTGDVQFFCPDKKAEDLDSTEYFYITVNEVSEEAFLYETEKFVFADGQAGKRYVERNNKMNGSEEEGSYKEGLISEDNSYMIYLCNYDYGLNKGQYQRNREILEKFYCFSAFQNNKIGINDDVSDKVRLHLRIKDQVEFDIPEGTVFEKTMEHGAVCLKFYLDDAKENFIDFYPYGCQYFEDEVWENQKRTLTDSSYAASALCYFKKDNGREIGQFSFLDSSLAVEFSVLEGNQQVLKSAMEVVKSLEVR